MDRTSFLGSLAALLTAPLAADGSEAAVAGADRVVPRDWEPLDKSEEAWRELLTEDEFRILRDEATERAGSSPLNREKREGTFICAGCFLPLFSSADKFMSGTGWPSFTRPVTPENVDTKRDFKLIWPRTEYHCARCGGHQGHIFDDGPEPTGQRWCNNGAALDFVPAGDDLPDLRQ
jgi:peptide-methionine (R)-S-oxide reductase